jgi:hypothetical protein
VADSQLQSLPPIAGEARPGYRLIVGASKPGSKIFGWKIVRDDAEHIIARRSLVPFRSLSDAHAAGVIALDNFREELIAASRPQVKGAH